jgi:hypothetical protein
VVGYAGRRSRCFTGLYPGEDVLDEGFAIALGHRTSPEMFTCRTVAVEGMGMLAYASSPVLHCEPKPQLCRVAFGCLLAILFARHLATCRWVP